MLYNRLMFYSYYLNIIWISVIRKREENTNRSSVKIWQGAGTCFPTIGICNGISENFTGTRNSESPVQPWWKLLGSSRSVAADSQGPGPELGVRAPWRKYKSIAGTRCRTLPLCTLYHLSQLLHVSQHLLQAPAAPHLHREPRIFHPEAHLWILWHPHPHLISINTPCGAKKRRWPAGINITVHQSYLCDDLTGCPTVQT